jgi:hypothetical protein
MTPYELLFARHLRNIYKKGAYKGDAPMDKRTQTNFRIIKGENMVVRMYHTNILTAFRNGEFEINLDGYQHRSSTRANINYALGVIKQGRMHLGIRSVMSEKQFVVSTPNGMYLYYDGIRFNQHGELVSTPKPFEARRIDRLESKAFMDNIKKSGFKDVYPLLYACSPEPDGLSAQLRYWDDYVQDAEQAHHWPHIISEYKYRKGWDNGTYGYYEINDAKACWSRMMSDAKHTMYNTIKTEVTKL